MAMVVATEEAGTTCLPTAMLNTTRFRGGNCRSAPLLLVKECVPAMVSVAHEAPLRTAYVSTANEALALPWIEKLPGQKRIRFVYGQIFVIQHYLGMRVIRAHICRDEERRSSPPRHHHVCPVVVLERVDLNHTGVVVHV